jgi:hypothetical protein
MQALHLRIGRVVVDAPAGADRHAIARDLQRELPQALGERLQSSAHVPLANGDATLSARVAEAVASRLLPGSGGR